MYLNQGRWLEQRLKNWTQGKSAEELLQKEVNWLTLVDPAPVVQKVDSAIRWINLYSVDNAIGFPNTYPLDRDLSGG